MSEVDHKARALSTARPAYPRAAERTRSEGVVRLRLLIDASGSVAAATVVSATGHPSLRSAAVRAAKSWRFSPAHHQGRAVAAWATQSLTFKLARR